VSAQQGLGLAPWAVLNAWVAQEFDMSLGCSQCCSPLNFLCVGLWVSVSLESPWCLTEGGQAGLGVVICTGQLGSLPALAQPVPYQGSAVSLWGWLPVWQPLMASA